MSRHQARQAVEQLLTDADFVDRLRATTPAQHRSLIETELAATSRADGIDGSTLGKLLDDDELRAIVGGQKIIGIDLDADPKL